MPKEKAAARGARGLIVEVVVMATNSWIHSQPITGWDKEQWDAHFRLVVERARRTRKPQIAHQYLNRGLLTIWRVHPINYDLAAVPRARRYWRERETVERFLHGLVCTSTDDLKPESRPQREPHSPDRCEAHSWKFLDKEHSALASQWTAAAGLLPELAQCQPCQGALLITEFARPDPRGRPAFKHDWYDLATAYKLTSLQIAGEVPRGFFRKLALHLSLPWLGLSFSDRELKQATCEIETELTTALGVIRNTFAARVRWGDNVVAAVLRFRDAPQRAALLI